MGSSYYPSYTFDSDFPGTHEICTWPSSAHGYLWSINSIEIRRRRQMKDQTSFPGMKKGEGKELHFTMPEALKDESYTLGLKIGNFKSSSYCYPSTAPPTYTLPTGAFSKIVEKF